jgi:hypothetical protein
VIILRFVTAAGSWGSGAADLLSELSITRLLICLGSLFVIIVVVLLFVRWIARDIGATDVEVGFRGIYVGRGGNRWGTRPQEQNGAEPPAPGRWSGMARLWSRIRHRRPRP